MTGPRLTSRPAGIAQRGGELGALARLAIPVIGAQLGQQTMSFVDNMLVGRLGAAALGGVGIGTALYFAITIFASGCVMGMDPVVAQAVGADDPGRARRVFWQGVRLAVWLGVPAALVIAVLPAALGPAGVDRETAHQAWLYLLGRAPNAVLYVLFAAQRSYLQSVQHTLPLLSGMVLANLVNVVTASFLVYGDRALAVVGLPGVGFSGWGVFGAGLGSTIAAVVSTLYVAAAIARVETPADPDRRRFDPVILRAILRVGVPVGLQLLVEVSVFCMASVLAGVLGPVPAAAHQVALALASTTFMVPLGVSMATAARVGRAMGRGDRAGARVAGIAGYQLGLGFMALAALAFVLFPSPLARLLASDPVIIAAAIPLVQIAAVFQLSDGAQVVGGGALRGLADTRSAFLGNVLGHCLIGAPLAILLAMVWRTGTPGLWWGLSAGLTVVALALAWRFFALSRPSVGGDSS